MTVQGNTTAPRTRSADPRLVVAGAIWFVGLMMTYRALQQATDDGGFSTFLVALVFQAVLTVAQSGVWNGSFSVIGTGALIIDTVLNFGGVNYYVAGMDKIGSVQALASQLGSGTTPDALKVVIALALAAAIAGLPEHLVKRR
jgi:hypothetical protein